ncbi:hypothetical protein MVEN_00220800 [Mycena venus]|uniref:Uncharacterized protein n=1 Tax=Mycena venus TaxID=2733690 RepID=A0A8H6Z313_9AGAR|nr:hypothetical protein MVEN_00220800 [Mycena venus]
MSDSECGRFKSRFPIYMQFSHRSYGGIRWKDLASSTQLQKLPPRDSFSRKTFTTTTMESRTPSIPARVSPAPFDSSLSVAVETSLASAVPTPARIAFISGPLAPTSNYFTEHYLPRLETAISEGHAFVVGPSRGIDASTLAYLLQRGVPPASITVFLSQSERSRQRDFAALGVMVVVAGRNHTERDAAMTAASDYDILRYQTEAECRALYGQKYRPRVSGTQLNEMRRMEMQAAAANAQK